MGIKWKNIESSNLESIGYNSELKTMYISFKNNTMYKYYKVSESLFDSFSKAESKGKYAHKYIYKNYDYSKIDDGKDTK